MNLNGLLKCFQIKMQNPIQLPYPFSSFNLASVFDLSSLNTTTNHHQIMGLNNSGSITFDSAKSSDTQSSFDNAMSHFLFPSTFFSNVGGGGHHHGFCSRNNSNGRESINSAPEKVLMKRDNSFSIDSLLGFNKVMQNGLVPSLTKEQPNQHLSQHRHMCGYGANNNINGLNLSQTFFKSEQEFCFNNLKKRKNSNAVKTHGVDKHDSKYHQKSNSSAPHNHLKTKSTNAKANFQDCHKGIESEKISESGQNALRRTTKTKRVRTIFTPEQLERLEAEFERQQYMVGPERLFLASSLHLTEAQVKVWFQNRRIKWRKQHLELQQQRLAVLRSQQIDVEDDEDSNSSDFRSSSPTPTILSSFTNTTMECNPDINYSTALAQHHHSSHLPS